MHKSAGVLYPFRFSRMEGVDAASERFEYPGRGAYDPKQLLDAGFGIHIAGVGRREEIVVTLSGAWAEFAKTHRWHSTQQLRPGRSEGTVDLSVRVPVCREVHSWILSFGDSAEVQKPKALRREIEERLARSLRAYTATRRTVTKARARVEQSSRKQTA